MSDTTTTPVAAPIAVDPSTPKAPAAPQAAQTDEKPHWLDARLERERTKLLKDLGVESLDDAKKALEELNAKREAEKSAAQKAAELENSLKAIKAEKEAMASALGALAKMQMSSLSDAQREAVAAVAGDDPAKQLKTIEALKPTWASAAAPAAPTPAPVQDTAPARSAPKDSGTVSPPDHKAVYHELKKTNPIVAARYAFAHGIFDPK